MITLRLFATRGFPTTQAQNRFAMQILVFRLRSGPSALLTTALRFSLRPTVPPCLQEAFVRPPAALCLSVTGKPRPGHPGRLGSGTARRLP